MNERIEAVVSGRVQGVMYRDFTCRTARGLQLVGEVKNLPDGTVRVVAEGPRAALEELVQKLHVGPRLSFKIVPVGKVESVSVSWLAATGSYRSFEITYG